MKIKDFQYNENFQFSLSRYLYRVAYNTIKMIEHRLRNLVISGYGNKLKKDKDLIKIISKENNKVMRISPDTLEQVIITGECSITSGFVRLLIANGVDLVFIGRNPGLFARVMRGDHNFITDLWRMQMLMSNDKKLEIAKAIIDSTIYNKIRLLQNLAKNYGAGIDISEGVAALNKHRQNIRGAGNIDVLMGYEGDSTRRYFELLRKFLPHDYGFEKRTKHPPLDPVNSMLSYGYTVLKSRCDYGLFLAGLNAYEGVLHGVYRNRSALGFDLMEEFRQPIVDRVVMTMIARKQINKGDFEFTAKGCFIDGDGKKLFLDLLYHRFEREYEYYGEKLSFLDIIFEQAKRLANAIRGDAKYVGFKYR